MTQRSILISGAEGQLGTELQRLLKSTDYVVHTPLEQDFDITNVEQVRQVIQTLQPNIVIHAAAITAVDWCETHPGETHTVNVEGTRNVVDAARQVGAKMVYISTDYVFDGTKQTPYVETDATNPLSVYGKTKLDGERLLGPTDLIVRTSWLYSATGNNIFRTLAQLAVGDQDLTFVTDQHGHPTSAVDLAARILWLLDRDAHGVFHVTNSGAVSWFEYAQAVFQAFGEPISRIKPVVTADLQPPRDAPRPMNSVLDNAALRSLGAPQARDFRDTLPELVDVYHKGVSSP